MKNFNSALIKIIKQYDLAIFFRLLKKYILFLIYFDMLNYKCTCLDFFSITTKIIVTFVVAIENQSAFPSQC